MNRFIAARNFAKKPWDQRDVRRNEVYIQMIHEKFREQLFGEVKNASQDAAKLQKVKSVLADHGLWKRDKKVNKRLLFCATNNMQ